MSLGDEGSGIRARINRSHKRAYVFFPILVQSIKTTISKATVILFPTLISSNKTVTKTTGVTII